MDSLQYLSLLTSSDTQNGEMSVCKHHAMVDGCVDTDYNIRNSGSNSGRQRADVVNLDRHQALLAQDPLCFRSVISNNQYDVDHDGKICDISYQKDFSGLPKFDYCMLNDGGISELSDNSNYTDHTKGDKSLGIVNIYHHSNQIYPADSNSDDQIKDVSVFLKETRTPTDYLSFHASSSMGRSSITSTVVSCLCPGEGVMALSRELAVSVGPYFPNSFVATDAYCGLEPGAPSHDYCGLEPGAPSHDYCGLEPGAPSHNYCRLEPGAPSHNYCGLEPGAPSHDYCGLEPGAPSHDYCGLESGAPSHDYCGLEPGTPSHNPLSYSHRDVTQSVNAPEPATDTKVDTADGVGGCVNLDAVSMVTGMLPHHDSVGAAVPLSHDPNEVAMLMRAIKSRNLPASGQYTMHHSRDLLHVSDVFSSMDTGCSVTEMSTTNRGNWSKPSLPSPVNVIPPHLSDLPAIACHLNVSDSFVCRQKQNQLDLSDPSRAATLNFPPSSLSHAELSSTVNCHEDVNSFDLFNLGLSTDLYLPKSQADQLLCVDFLSSSRDRLSDMMRLGQFCDAVLATSLHSIKVHKAILCSASAYLCGVLSQTCMGRSGGRVLTVQFKADISAKSLSAFVDLIYHGRMKPAVDIVRDVNVMARCLHMDSLRNMTEDALLAMGIGREVDSRVPELLLLETLVDKCDKACSAFFPIADTGPLLVPRSTDLRNTLSVTGLLCKTPFSDALSQADQVLMRPNVCKIFSSVGSGAPILSSIAHPLFSGVNLCGLFASALNTNQQTYDNRCAAILPNFCNLRPEPTALPYIPMQAMSSSQKYETFMHPMVRFLGTRTSPLCRLEKHNVQSLPSVPAATFCADISTNLLLSSSTFSQSRPNSDAGHIVTVCCDNGQHSIKGRLANCPIPPACPRLSLPSYPAAVLVSHAVHDRYPLEAQRDETPLPLPSTLHLLSSGRFHSSSCGQVSTVSNLDFGVDAIPNTTISSLCMKSRPCPAASTMATVTCRSVDCAALSNGSVKLIGTDDEDARCAMDEHRGRTKKARIAAAMMPPLQQIIARATSPHDHRTSTTRAHLSPVCRSPDDDVCRIPTSTAAGVSPTVVAGDFLPSTCVGPPATTLPESVFLSDQRGVESDVQLADVTEEVNSRGQADISAACHVVPSAAGCEDVVGRESLRVSSSVSNSMRCGVRNFPVLVRRKNKGKSSASSASGGGDSVRVRAPPKKRAKMELERIIKERCEAKQEEDMACSAGMDSVTDVQCVRENSVTVERVEKLGRERSVSERLIKMVSHKTGKRPRWIKNDRWSRLVIALNDGVGRMVTGGDCMLQCKLCGNQFLMARRCVVHVAVTHKVPDRDVVQSIQLTAPSSVHDGRPSSDSRLVCDICGYRSRDNSTYYIHYHRYFKHSVPLPPGWSVYTCDMCGKELFTKFQLKDHKRAHHEPTPFVCEVCGSGFKSRRNLTSHVLHRHQEERKHLCSACHRTFKTRTQLSVHERTHTGQRPFGCPTCDYRSTTRGNLRLHLTNRHKMCSEETGAVMRDIALDTASVKPS